MNKRPFVAAIALIGTSTLAGLADQPLNAPANSTDSGNHAPQLAPPNAFDKRLAELDARLGAVRSLRAEFEQHKRTPLLKKPLISTGAITVKGDRVKWRTDTPRRSIMTVAAGEIRIHYPDDQVVEVYAASHDRRELFATPLPRLAALRSFFEITPIDAASMGAPNAEDRFVALELLPTTTELKEHVAVVRVLIDSDLPCITKMEITDPDGARTTIELKSIEVNISITDEEISPSIPPGTRISRPLQGRSEPAPDAGTRQGPGR